MILASSTLTNHVCGMFYDYFSSNLYQSNSVPVGWFTSLSGCSSMYSYPRHTSLFSFLTKLYCFPKKQTKKQKKKKYVMPVHIISISQCLYVHVLKKTATVNLKQKRSLMAKSVMAT